MKKLVYFVDPNSYNNLEIYDDSLLQEVNRENELNIEFFASNLFKGVNTSKYKLNFIYSYNQKKGFLKIVSYILSQLYLILRILANKPSIVHFQWIKIYNLDLFLIRIIKFFCPNTQVIYTAHNLLPHDSGVKFLKFFKKFYNKVDHIIVHTNESKTKLIDLFQVRAEKINVIPHGLLNYVDKVQEVKKVPNIKAGGEIIFALIGSLNPYKGVDLLIDSWSSYFRDRKDVKLVLAGKGDLSKYVNLNLIENVLVINRYLSDNEFVSLLEEVDVILLPYREISQSGVLLTVLNEKKLLLVSDLPALTKPFDFGKIGWILKDFTPSDLKNSIEEAVSDVKSGFSTSEEVWSKIHDYYSWHNIGNITRNLYLSNF